MKGDVLKPNPEYTTVWLDLAFTVNQMPFHLFVYCSETHAAWIILALQQRHVHNFRTPTKISPQILVAFCWVPWLLHSKYQIYCSSDKLLICLKICYTCTVVWKSIHIIFCSLSFDMFFCKRNVWWSYKSSESIFSRTTYKNWSGWRKCQFIIIKGDYRCILGFDCEAQTLFYLNPYFP